MKKLLIAMALLAASPVYAQRADPRTAGERCASMGGTWALSAGVYACWFPLDPVDAIPPPTSTPDGLLTPGTGANAPGGYGRGRTDRDHQRRAPGEIPIECTDGICRGSEEVDVVADVEDPPCAREDPATYMSNAADDPYGVAILGLQALQIQAEFQLGGILGEMAGALFGGTAVVDYSIYSRFTPMSQVIPDAVALGGSTWRTVRLSFFGGARRDIPIIRETPVTPGTPGAPSIPTSPRGVVDTTGISLTEGSYDRIIRWGNEPPPPFDPRSMLSDHEAQIADWIGLKTGAKHQEFLKTKYGRQFLEKKFGKGKGSCDH